MNKKIFAIILVQIILLIYISTQKHGYLCDEIWTFNISNAEKTLFDDNTPFKNYLNTPLAKQVFIDFFKQDSSKLFDFSVPCKNTYFDTHPPLYYCIIHFVSSIFILLDINFSVFIGIIPNLIFFIITQISIYLISKQTIKNTNVCLIVNILYGFSLACIDSIIIIRMYSMLTALTCIFLYLHIKEMHMISIGCNKPYIFFSCTGFVFVVSFLTQLYFIIVSFFICLFFFCFVIEQKKYKYAIQYVLTMLISLLLSIFICNDILLKLFGSNQHVEHIAKELTNAEFLRKFLDWIRIFDICANINFWILIIVCYILFKLIFALVTTNTNSNILEVRHIHFKFNFDIISIYILFVWLMTLLVVSKITLLMSPRYIFFITPLFFIFIISILEKNIHTGNTKKFCILFVLVCIAFVSNYNKYKDIMWLCYEQQIVDEVINNSNPKKLLIVVRDNENGYEPWWPALTATQLAAKINETIIVKEKTNFLDINLKNEENLLLFIDERIDKRYIERLKDCFCFSKSLFLYEYDEGQGKVYFLSKT